MSTNTNVQLIPGDLVLSGDIKTDEVTPTFSVDRQNSRVGIGIDASSISNPYTMYVAGEMYATRLHGDGSQLSGLTDSAWGQAGGDISYVDGDVSIGIADANGKRLRVHESGNDVLVADGANLRVGVATGTPQANLHVEGNAYVSSNLEVSNVNFTGNLYQNGTLFEGGGGGVWTETGDDIYYTTGNVGIGTTNPGANLHVEGNAYISGTTISSDSFLAPDASVEWAAKIAGSRIDRGQDIAVDSSGNVYAIGYYEISTVDVFSQGSTTPATQLDNSGYNDVFIAKYFANGNVDWATKISGTDSDEGRGINVDSSGNIYVTGNYSSSPLTFYNADGTAFGTTLSNSGSDVFIAKYFENGDVDWVARVAGTSYDYGRDISVDSSGNVYITGDYDSSPLTFYNKDGEAFSTTLPRTGFMSDVFIAKYLANGDVAWAANVSGSGNDLSNGISVDNSGNVHIIGNYTSSTLTLYNKDGAAFGTTLSNPGSSDVFIAKYFANGNVDWATKIRGTNSDEGFGISVDSSGNVYVTGYFTSTLTLYNEDGTAFGTTLTNSGYYDAFIAKYLADGTVDWATRVAGTSYDYGQGISVDSGGNVYIIGNYSSSPLTFYNKDGTAFGTTLSNSSSTFIAKYNTNGVVQWVASCGGNGRSVFVNNGENVYVVGDYSSTLTLYNTDGTAFGTTLSNSGYNDVFIAKYTTPKIQFTSLDSSNSLVINTNVGIGTNQPQANLHVEGNAYVSSNLEVSGSVAGPFTTFLTGDVTTSIVTSIASTTTFYPLTSYTFNVPSEYHIYGTKNLEIYGQIKWCGEISQPPNSMFSARVYYGSGLTSYIDSAENTSSDASTRNNGAGVPAINFHDNFASTLDSCILSSRFYIANCPVSNGSQLKLELRYRGGNSTSDVYTNRTSTDTTGDINFERGTTNFFLAVK